MLFYINTYNIYPIYNMYSIYIDRLVDRNRRK